MVSSRLNRIYAARYKLVVVLRMRSVEFCRDRITRSRFGQTRKKCRRAAPAGEVAQGRGSSDARLLRKGGPRFCFTSRPRHDACFAGTRKRALLSQRRDVSHAKNLAKIRGRFGNPVRRRRRCCHKNIAMHNIIRAGLRTVGAGNGNVPLYSTPCRFGLRVDRHSGLDRPRWLRACRVG
jgi:hypothetical protein